MNIFSCGSSTSEKEETKNVLNVNQTKTNISMEIGNATEKKQNVSEIESKN